MVEAALTKGRPAASRSQLSKVEKVQGNTQRPLDRALDMVEKSRVEIKGLRDGLKEAAEGRQKTEVEAAVLTVEVEALQKAKDDLQQRLGMGETQVRTITSTLNATFR